ncbi:MAG: hypothetical protein MUC83_15550, partial [Pirellula sp.]|nr:hypothetical protein [Pirellula sp.]
MIVTISSRAFGLLLFSLTSLSVPKFALAVTTNPDTPAITSDQAASGPDGDPTLFQHDDLVDRVQEKMVKIFGAGGARGLES